MRRNLLPLLAGTALALAACGNDDTSSGLNCGAGTIEQNGQCVAAPTDTSSPQDTGTTSQDTYQPAQDTYQPAQDTGGNTQDTSTTDPNVCQPDEASVLDVGQPCTKDCQCRQDIGAYCYDGPFMEGFHFCTIQSTFNNPDPESYQQMSTNSKCLGYENDKTKVYLHVCTTLDDCKAIASQYTNCGTQGLVPNAAATACPYLTDNDPCGGGVTLSLDKKVCIISSLPPFDICNN